MKKVTVVWADEDLGLETFVFHGEVDGSISDHRVRLSLLHQAMEAQMDPEMLALSSDLASSHILAILQGHADPLYQFDGDFDGTD